MLPGTDYIQILTHLKERIREARLHAALAANSHMLNAYWEIGDTIRQQEKEAGWGTKIVEKLGKDLKVAFQDMKGFSLRNLRYMRDFAIAYPDFSILQRSVAKLQVNENEQKTI